MKLPKELKKNIDVGSKDNKGKICSVKECNEVAIRSLSENKWNKYIEKAKLIIDENKRHNIYLCKIHYKEANKIRKSEEKLYGQQKGFLQDSKASKKGRWDSY